jgi:VWFA-related protein
VLTRIMCGERVMRARHLLVFAVAVAVSAQQQPDVQPRVESQVYVTAIDVVVDVRDKAGKLPAGLKASDFVVVEDGLERTVVGAQYLRRDVPSPAVPASVAPAPAAAPAEPKTEWQFVLYFETELSSSDSRKTIARELSKQADHLASVGTVDVILADPTPHALVRDSRDPESIRAALKKVMVTAGANRLALHRRHFLDDIQAQSSLASMRERSGISPGGTAARVTLTTIRPYVQQEVQLISHFRSNLLGWLASYRRHMPRSLLLSTDGFDVNPIEFYRNYLYSGTSDLSFDEMVRLADSVAKTGEMLAAAGWTTMSIPGNNNAAFGTLDDATTSGIGRANQALTMGRSEGPNRNQALYQPREPLQKIADATGGSVLANSAKIAAAVASIDDRILLTYQVDRKPDGKPRKIEIRMRDPKLKVRTAQWVSSATPDDLAQLRAIKLLDATNFTGDFPVNVMVEWNAPGANKTGTMRVVGRLDAVRAFLPASGRGAFRVTMAVQVPNKAFAVNTLLPDSDFSSGFFQFGAPISIPADATGMSLVIEEMSSGLSGTARVTVP